jgi:VWFA-related protein
MRAAYPSVMRPIVLLLAMMTAGSVVAQYAETITVRRLLVDARVTTLEGEPVRPLGPEDFTVRIGGRRATVESAEWIDDEAGAPIADILPPESHASLPVRRPAGRTLILFIQTDFGRNEQRLKGQMSFNHRLVELVESLPPGDRVAVFSFDSHLKFRSDLTTDRKAAVDAIRESLRIDQPPPPPLVPSPSLASRLDRDAMRRTTSSEAALLHLAQALSRIEGPKSLLLAGWGLGERAGGVVNMKRQWTAARAALDAARVSIFALDTTLADYHDLEHGMKVAAAQTGGFYAKTHMFAQAAVDRLRRTLRGHYELTLRVDDALRPGTHPLSVRVRRRGATTLAPASVIVRP